MEEIIIDNGYSNMRKMLEDYLFEVQEKTAKESVTGISSGFRPLDDLTGGFENGKVYVIGGRPCIGKEEFMLSMIRSIAVESDLPVLLFSTNYLKSDYVSRLLSIHCDVSTSYLQKGCLEPQDWVKLDKGLHTLADAPLFIHDSMDLPLKELMETTRNCIKETGIKIIFIDCLQMIDFTKEDNNVSEKIAKIMFSLKRFAHYTNLPIVVGSMMNRVVEYREGNEGKRPQLMDLANSCFIEELADVVMMVHRPEYYSIYQDEYGQDLHGQMQILVRKNILKPLGEIVLYYLHETGAVTVTKEPLPF